MSKYLDSNGLLYFWQKLKTMLGGKVDKETGKGLSTNDYTTTEKTKLAGIEEGANNYSLPTASASTLGGIKVGENLTITNGVLSAVQGAYELPTASASTKGGVKIGSNLTMTGEVLSATDTTYNDATESVHGLMSVDDKKKLNAFDEADTYATKQELEGKVDKETGKGLSANDYTTAEKTKLAGIADNANNYVLPVATSSVLGGVKQGTNITINSSGVISATDTTYNDATTSVHGLMSTADKAKLDAFNAASTYATKDDLDTKVDKVSGKGLSTNDYTTAEKTKLSGIAENANNYVLPAASSSTLGGVKQGTNITITAAGVISATDTTYNDATTSVHGLMSTTDKSKLDAFQSASSYALKTEIAGVYKYKGSVPTYADLPTTGLTTGDVYNVEANGQNYAWTGTAWDSLGEIFTITDISNSDIDTIVNS